MCRHWVDTFYSYIWNLDGVKIPITGVDSVTSALPVISSANNSFKSCTEPFYDFLDMNDTRDATVRPSIGAARLFVIKHASYFETGGV